MTHCKHVWTKLGCNIASKTWMLHCIHRETTVNALWYSLLDDIFIKKDLSAEPLWVTDPPSLVPRALKQLSNWSV